MAAVARQCARQTICASSRCQRGEIGCAGQPDRAKGTLDALPADVPLAVPAVVLLVEMAGATATVVLALHGCVSFRFRRGRG